MVGRLEPQLAAQHIVFAHLRLLESHLRRIPVSRRIRHGRIQPQGEELVAQVVVFPDVLPAGPQTVRPQPVGRTVHKIHQPDPPVGFSGTLQHRRFVRIADKPGNDRDQIARLPQPVHVSLPEPHRPTQHAGAEKCGVLHPDLRPRFFTQPAENLLRAVRQNHTQPPALHAGERGKKDRGVVHLSVRRVPPGQPKHRLFA